MGYPVDKHARSSDDHQTVENFEEDATDPVLDPTEAAADPTEWAAEAEGYTPLADMNTFAGTMFMAMPLPEGEDSGGVFFADMTAFPSAPYASIAQMNGDSDSEMDGSVGENSDDIDMSLAEQALKALDDEYAMTIRGLVPEIPKVQQTENQDPLVSGLTQNEAGQHDEEDEKLNFDDAEFNPSRLSTFSFPALQSLPPQTKDLPPIDTEAVRRAVAAIQLKDPKLNSNLDKWKKEHYDLLAPKEHPIIPQIPLAAFRKRTAKAKQATANLSRAATIADALNRLGCLHGQDILTIHIIGADYVECGSKDILHSFFGPLVRWIGAVDLDAPSSIQIHLVGPNLTDAMTSTTTTPLDLMPLSKLKQTSPLVSASATCHVGMYHDWLPSNKSVPDLVVAFNAGIWGYSDWKPTLEALCRMPVPLVVSSYTVQEGDDDGDVIRDIIAASGSTKDDHCIWSVEPNPYGSRMKRETITAIKGREYRENAAWQAWRLCDMPIER